MKRITKRGSVTAMLAGALAVGAMVPALAQSEDEVPAEPQHAEDEDCEQMRDQFRERMAVRLAEELDVDEGDVTGALDTLREEFRGERQAAMEDRLSEAVESGDITQERADEMLEALESGQFPGRGGFGGMKGGPMGHGSGGPFGTSA